MASKTAEKLTFLKSYIELHFPDWKTYFGHNLLGVCIGYIETNGVYKQRYSIVFHVKKKYSNPSKLIPTEYVVDIPNQGTKKIPTDVVEVGKFKLQNSHLGKRVKPKGNYQPGTVGFFLKRNGLFYLCSNMHVLGHKYIKEGQKYFYRHVSNQVEVDILTSPNTGAYLEHGFFEDIDAAIARLHPRDIRNGIPGHGKPKGYYIVNFYNLNIMRRKRFLLYGAITKNVSTRLLEIGKVIVDNPYNNQVYLTDLIKMQRCAHPGDSGAPVFETRSMNLLGIVVGSDNRFTYLIPIDKILNRFHAEFLY